MWNIKECDTHTHISRKSYLIESIRWWLQNSWNVFNFVCNMNQTLWQYALTPESFIFVQSLLYFSAEVMTDKTEVNFGLNSMRKTKSNNHSQNHKHRPVWIIKVWSIMLQIPNTIELGSTNLDAQPFFIFYSFIFLSFKFTAKTWCVLGGLLLIKSFLKRNLISADLSCTLLLLDCWTKTPVYTHSNAWNSKEMF